MLAESTPAVAAPKRVKTEGATPKAGVLAFLRETPALLAAALLLAFLLRSFVVQVFWVPSISMVPTLEVNDRFVVEKLTYLFREPVRGEVVVFEGVGEPTNPDESFARRFVQGAGQFLGLVPADAEDFVKRVIGLPGDTVRIDENGSVSVNGFTIEEHYKVEDRHAAGPFVVPAGKLFVLGDNRPHSADSRVTEGLGFVDIDRVVGRAMVIIWPFDNVTGLGTPDYGDIPDPA